MKHLNRARRHMTMILAGAVLGPSLGAWGQTISNWVEPVSGLWTEPAMWSSNPNYPRNGLPTAFDTYQAVIAAVGGNYTITLNSSVALNGLTINSPNATLYHNSGSLTLFGNGTVASGVYHLDGGTLSGGSLLVNSAMEWTGGTMSGPGRTIIAAGAVLDSGSGISSRTLSRTLENRGIVNLGSSTLMLNNGTLLNLAGAVLNSSKDFGGGGSSLFSNLGTWNFSGAIGAVGAFVGGNVVNSGTINVASGSLGMGGVSTSITHNGGSVIKGGGGLFLYGSQVLGPGITTFAGGSINLSNGSFTGAGQLNLTGTMNWNDGTIGGSGTMSVLPGATLNAATASGNRQLSRPLNNQGVMNLITGQFAINSRLTNLPDGVMNVSPTASISFIGTGSVALNNQGLMNIQTGSNSLLAMINSGTINVSSGMFNVGNGSFVHEAGSTITGAGWINLGSFSSSSHVISGKTTLAGTNMVFSNGTFTGNGQLDLTGTLAWNGGTIGGGSNSAAMNIQPGAALNLGQGLFRSLGRTLNNRGVVNLSAGQLDIAVGGTLNNLPDGVMNLSQDVDLTSNGSGSVGFYNNGLVNVMAGVGSVIFSNLSLTNAGVISANSGSLGFGVGTFIHNGGSVLAGPGTIELSTSSTTHKLVGTTTLAGTNVNLRSGTIVGNGSLNVTGVLNWFGGAMTGDGSVNIAAGAILNIGTQSTSRMLSRQMDNHGTADFTSGDLSLNSATFNNHAGAVLNISSPTNFTGSAPSLLFNGGTMNLSDETIVISVPFVNLGVVNVGSGMSLATAWANGGTINGPVDNLSLMTLRDGAVADAIDGSGDVVAETGAAASVQRIRQNSLDIQPGATVLVRPNGGDESTSVLDSLSIASGGVLDLADNNLVVAPGGSSAEEIRQQLQSGRIISSSATTAKRLGYGDNAELGKSEFAGQPADPFSLLVGFTWAGDTNLDGKVTISDLGDLASHWQSTTAVWTGGDFNYDGQVTISDLGDLASNWQAGVSSPLAMSFAEALQMVGLGGEVPEPMMSVLVFAWSLKRPRR